MLSYLNITVCHVQAVVHQLIVLFAIYIKIKQKLSALLTLNYLSLQRKKSHQLRRIKEATFCLLNSVFPSHISYALARFLMHLQGQKQTTPKCFVESFTAQFSTFPGFSFFKIFVCSL